jgi:hypothetical protein
MIRVKLIVDTHQSPVSCPSPSTVLSKLNTGMKNQMIPCHIAKPTHVQKFRNVKYFPFYPAPYAIGFSRLYAEFKSYSKI